MNRLLIKRCYNINKLPILIQETKVTDVDPVTLGVYFQASSTLRNKYDISNNRGGERERERDKERNKERT